jgi:3-phosphoglycerate kinase
MLSQKLNQVWLAIKSIVLIGDNDLVITDANRYVTYAFGWTKNELLAKNISFILPKYPADLADDTPLVLRARHKNNKFFDVIAQSMRDPMSSMVAWVLTPITLPPMYDFTFDPSSDKALGRKMTVDDVDMRDRRVLVRVDFNVPIDKDGLVRDDKRIRAAIPTIRRVIENGGKAILVSHLGRPDGKVVPELSLRPTSRRLAELMGKRVHFVDNCLGAEATSVVKGMKMGDIVMLENLRFHEGESSKDINKRNKMASVLASYCDLVVSDAFGTAHREAASTTGVARFIGACIAGYLMEKEVTAVRYVVDVPSQPVVSIIGGSKVSDKISLMTNLFQFSQTVIVGGAMAFTFLEAMGHCVGKSRCERVAHVKGREIDLMSLAKSIMENARKNKVRLIFPVDHACAKNFANDEPFVTKSADIPADMMGLDYGPQTIALCEDAIRDARTVIWNGPVGVFELPNFATGCHALAKAISVNTECYSLVGGGDTAAAVLPFRDAFSHVSTGGGATLELLQGKVLPGLMCLTPRISRTSKL